MGSEMLGVPCSVETALAGVAEEASAAKSSMRTGGKSIKIGLSGKSILRLFSR